MTRERIEDMREVVLPFVKKRLLETNYENLGESDAEEFTRDFNEILDLAIKALEQEPILDKIRAEIEHTEIVYDKSTDYKDDRTDAEKAAVQWKMDKLLVLGIIDKYKAESEG